MTDLIIGAITKLTWEQCLPWTNSILRSGFTGDKVICIFGEDQQPLAQKFAEAGFKPILTRYLNESENICVTRFFVYYSYLYQNRGKYKSVIATDVSDVVFQRNPSEFMNEQPNQTIILSSENIKYNDEIWGRNILKLSFGNTGPAMVERLKDNQIFNCGVLAGSQELMQDLFFNINAVCDGRPQQVPGGGGPDQAALNVIMDLLPYRNVRKIMAHDTGWACQVGTTADPNKVYDHVNIDPNPSLHEDIVETSDGVPYYIVHQYNRNPIWKSRIEAKYG